MAVNTLQSDHFPALNGPPQMALVKASVYTPPPVKQRFLAKVVSEIAAARWIITGGTVIGLCLGFGYSVLRTPLYESHASMEVQGNPQDQEAGDAALEAQVRLLQSHSILEQALSHLPENERRRLAGRPRLGSAAPDVLETIKQRLRVMPSAASQIIDIRFLSPDPQAGADFVNLLTQQTSDFGVEAQWKVVRRSSDWLQPQLMEARKKLDASEKALDEYSRDMEMALPGAHRDRMEKQALYDSLRSTPDSAGPALSRAKNDYLAAVAWENTLRGQAGSETSVRYTMLKQQAQADRQLYQDLTTRIADAGIASTMKSPNIVLLDSAYAAHKPVSPDVPLDAAAGAGAGALASLALVMFRRAASPTFSQPGSLGRVLGLPELGAVPKIPSRRRMADAVIPLNEIEDAAQSESYRAIRSSLLYQSVDGSPRCLVFTSASAGEGKTTVVTNLGMSLAATDRRILLIDGDMRRPMLHRVFGVEPSPGLSDLLRRDRLIGSNGNGSDYFVEETGVHNLFLLPCGTAGGDGPEQLAGERLPAILRELRKNFDVILIDTPPLLPCADARGFARAADGAVLVVRADQTEQRDAGLARDTLLHDGSQLIGTVLTGFHANRSAYGYHGYGTTSE